MDPELDGVPSVGCLLYLAAGQLVAHRPSIVPFSMTRVPCKRVWVHSVHLAAMVLAATLLSLQESGHLSFRIHQEPWPGVPGAVRTSLTLYTEVLDSTARPGLPGELLSIAIQSRDSRVGTAQGSAGLYGTDLAQVLGSSVQHPYVKYAVRRELAQEGTYTKSWGVFRPDCARIVRLEAPCAEAVRWWKQQQADAPHVCALLFAICRMASTPPSGGGG
jgi:hypothetical protein